MPQTPQLLVVKHQALEVSRGMQAPARCHSGEALGPHPLVETPKQLVPLEERVLPYPCLQHHLSSTMLACGQTMQGNLSWVAHKQNLEERLWTQSSHTLTQLTPTALEQHVLWTTGYPSPASSQGGLLTREMVRFSFIKRYAYMCQNAACIHIVMSQAVDVSPTWATCLDNALCTQI
jgi:hypothetical protein